MVVGAELGEDGAHLNVGSIPLRPGDRRSTRLPSIVDGGPGGRVICAEREFFVLIAASAVALRVIPLPAGGRRNRRRGGQAQDLVLEHAAAHVAAAKLAGANQIRLHQQADDPADTLTRPAKPAGNTALARPAYADLIDVVGERDKHGDHLAVDTGIGEPSSNGVTDPWAGPCLPAEFRTLHGSFGRTTPFRAVIRLTRVA